MEVEKKITLDLLNVSVPAMSSTSDMPVIETKPDATNKGAPPKEPEAKESETMAAPEAETPADDKTKEESATSPEETSASDEPVKKPAKGVQKRLDELTREREEARRLAESERQERLRLLALLESKDKPKAQPDGEDPEPQKPVKDPANPEAYEAALEKWIEERSSWTARRETKTILEEANRKAAEQQATERAREAQQVYASRVEKAKVKYPDYTEVAESPDVQISIPMAHAITQSEDGADIAYFLGKNPEEAKRISSLAPPLQLVELGKISARLTQPTPKPVSAAPAPGKPIKASAEVTKTPEEETMEEYAARRKKELAADRRPGVRH